MKEIVISGRLLDKLTQGIDVKINVDNKSVKSVCRLRIYNTDLIHISFGDAYAILGTQPPKWGNFFDNRAGETSFHPKPDNQELNSEGKWRRDGRQVVKPAKLVNFLIDKGFYYSNVDKRLKESTKEKVKARYIELLSNNIKSSDTHRIQVSENPSDIYKKDTAPSKSGSLQSSCMRPESDYGCRNHTDFYDEAGAKIAYIENEKGELEARALLWDKAFYVESGEKIEFKLMDRIYGSENAIEAFKIWAQENGYAHKVHQSSDSSKLILKEEKRISEFEVEIENDIDRRAFPYMDTFVRLDGQKLLSYNGVGIDMQNTDGNSVMCVECDCDIDPDEAYHIDGDPYCGGCAGECEYTGLTVLREDLVFSDYHNYELSRDHAVYISSINDHVNDSVPFVESRRTGQTFLLDHDEIVKCSYCEDHVHQDDARFDDELNVHVCNAVHCNHLHEKELEKLETSKT